jgi:ubiquinone/menaquinone biosynthesis C-methylase UbiE
MECSVNVIHLLACRSRWWQRHLDRQVLPKVLSGTDLRGDLLELGPGPGLVTRRLAQRVGSTAGSLTVVEIDAGLASTLRQRFSDRGVRVVEGSATRLPFPDASFDVVVACTMLHHVPSPAEQQEVLREAVRVLRPGGWFVGSDSLPSFVLRMAHLRDTMVLVDVRTLAEHLTAAGAVNIDVEEHSSFFVFRGQRPAT